MTSQNSQFGMLSTSISPGPSYGSNRLTPTASPGVHQAIDDYLNDTMKTIKNAHEELAAFRGLSKTPTYQPYAGVADYIAVISRALSDLTTALTQESIKKDASALVMAHLAGPGLSDSTAFFKLENDKAQLMRIHQLTLSYDRSIRAQNDLSHSPLQPIVYSPSFSSPNSIRKPLPGPASPISVQSRNSSVNSPTAGMISPGGRGKVLPQVEARGARGSSPRIVSDKDHFANYNLDRWKRRGKDARNYCPRGYDCKKGGVVNGELVLFERNSAFIQHCNKHKRPFVCELPGCPNPIQRRSFARADGLRRHQDHVSHGVPCENNADARDLVARRSIGSQESQTLGPRTVLKPENDYYDPGSDDSDDSEMEEAASMKLDTG